MAQTFTNEEFEGINFNCYSKEANVGWYHICEAVQDGNVLVTNKVHWINRTWESYTYQTAYEGCMNLLRNMNVKPEIEINDHFWNGMADDNEYIYDYGTTTYNNTIVLFESWEQHDKFYHLFVNLEEELTEDEAEEVKLIESKYGLTREQIAEQWNKCIEEEGFYDSYNRCSECGRLMSEYEGTILNDEMYCDECCENHGDELIDEAIEKSQADFREAISVSFDDDLLEAKGFTYIVDSDNDRRTFGAYSFEDMSEYYFAQDIHRLFTGTVIKLTGVGQFQTYFHVAVPDEYSEIAQAFVDHKLTEENVERFINEEITEDELWETYKDNKNDEEE